MNEEIETVSTHNIVAFRGNKQPNIISNEASIRIDKNLCKKIEDAHYRYNSSAYVEKLFLDSHRNDVNGNIVNSPIFKEYHRQTIEAMVEYEELKKILVERYELEEYDWKLDFKDCKVLLI